MVRQMQAELGKAWQHRRGLARLGRRYLSGS
jgi:hypothetical protein